MATFVTLTRLDGQTVDLNAESNFSLAPVPANLLPPNIPAGCYVTFTETNTRVAVIGDVATISALLSAAVGAGFVHFGVASDPAGNILSNTGLVASIGTIISDPGQYTVQLAAPAAGVTSGIVVAGVGDLNHPPTDDLSATATFTGTPGQIRVVTFDPAGVAAPFAWNLLGAVQV